MLLYTIKNRAVKRISDLTDVYRGQTAMLVGGAPSLREQPIHRLHERGVLSVAMNNAAIHFQPDIWISSDRPECYEPQIIMDPKILKLSPISHAEVQLDERAGKRAYASLPNTMFYDHVSNIPWSKYLDRHNAVPWYNNTLMSSIHILYQLGIRRIILAGSDFGFGKDGAMYAHSTKLGSLQQKWNIDLYNGLVRELTMLNGYFESKGLELLDCSKYSRLKHVYRHIDFDEAVDMCKGDFPESMCDPGTLPHCSKFAPTDIKKAIAGWPGHDSPEPLSSTVDVMDDDDMISVL